MPRGGKRPGAGRPRKIEEKPLSLSEAGAPSLGKVLEEKGLQVKSEARKSPVPSSAERQILEAGPKSTYVSWGPTGYSAANIRKFGMEYRRDSLVRGCINILAFFATNNGFETVLEPVQPMEEAKLKSFQEKYRHVKDVVDQVNAKVNLDYVLRTAVVKAKIYGFTGFEIVRNGDGLPEMLIPLDSTKLKPEIGSDWTLEGWTYNGQKGFYQPDEVLYFVNNQLETNLEGLSDVEPIIDALATRRSIIREALMEGARVLWAGIAWHMVDTSGMSEEKARETLEAHKRQVKPGKHIITNQKIQVQFVDLKPDLEKLITILDYLDMEITGNFKVPRFLVGREKQYNRATAYAELESFVNGPITDIQRWLRREVERQWYPPIVHTVLGEEPPLVVKHKWNPISTADYVQLIESVSRFSTGIAKLYGQGQGVLTRDETLLLVQKLADLLDLPWEELQRERRDG